ncbi:hypothetical protein C8J57DRAFT_746221 [Mycena rebaudengoi]|nr:hypothetical protein C8J57DRAFT_746221 [Mycena rebaudengoi]
MPEDSQPNDLRGRRALESTIPPILSAHPIPLHRSHLSHPSLPKRSSSPSYASTPAKRRRLTSRRIEPSQKDVRREIIRPLPLSCRKGVSHCHSNRKQFIANEIKSLQKSEPGLRVQAHSVTDDAVLFSCVQSDILNCSLAPNLEPANKLPEKSRSQPKVDPPVVAVPIISGVSGPIRVFKSGTISFQPPVPVAETGVEGGLVSRKPDLFKTDTKRVPPAATVQTPAPPLEPKESLRSITSSSVYLESGATSRESTRSDKQAMLALEPLPSTSSTASSLGTIAIPDTSQKPVIKMASTLRFSSYIYEPDGDEFQLPSRQQYDKLRRFLCGPSASSSVVVSMYGAVDGVDVAARRHWLVSQGSNPTKAAVDDACLVTDGGRSFAVLAHGRDNEQLSFVNISRDGGTVRPLSLSFSSRAEAD